MGLIYTAILLLGCTSGFASQVHSVTITTDASDTLDRYHVAQGLYKAMAVRESTSGTTWIKTTKTNGRITCVKGVDANLSDAFAIYDCTFTHFASPLTAPRFLITTEAELIDIVSAPEYYKDIDTTKIPGATCQTVSVPGRLATPPHDRTNCRFRLN